MVSPAPISSRVNRPVGLPYGANGRNMFGMASPLVAQTGGDPNKMAASTQYYKGILEDPNTPPGTKEQIKGMFDPSTADPSLVRQMFQGREMDEATRQGALKQASNGTYQSPVETGETGFQAKMGELPPGQGTQPYRHQTQRPSGGIDGGRSYSRPMNNFNHMLLRDGGGDASNMFLSGRPDEVIRNADGTMSPVAVGVNIPDRPGYVHVEDTPFYNLRSIMEEAAQEPVYGAARSLFTPTWKDAIRSSLSEANKEAATGVANSIPFRDFTGPVGNRSARTHNAPPASGAAAAPGLWDKLKSALAYNPPSEQPGYKPVARSWADYERQIKAARMQTPTPPNAAPAPAAPNGYVVQPDDVRSMFEAMNPYWAESPMSGKPVLTMGATVAPQAVASAPKPVVTPEGKPDVVATPAPNAPVTKNKPISDPQTGKPIVNAYTIGAPVGDDVWVKDGDHYRLVQEGAQMYARRLFEAAKMDPKNEDLANRATQASQWAAMSPGHRTAALTAGEAAVRNAHAVGQMTGELVTDGKIDPVKQDLWNQLAEFNRTGSLPSPTVTTGKAGVRTLAPNKYGTGSSTPFRAPGVKGMFNEAIPGGKLAEKGGLWSTIGQVRNKS